MGEVKLNAALLASALEDWATSLFARYGHPVYLVGSALDTSDYMTLRDVDIVIVLPDVEFANRFGGDWLDAQGGACAGRWATEVGKLARYASRHHAGLNFDVKVQSESWAEARHRGHRRRRLDRGEYAHGRDTERDALTAERDALRARVAELEAERDRHDSIQALLTASEERVCEANDAYARADERAAVVLLLRGYGNNPGALSIADMADYIERGDHVRGGGEG